MYILVSRAIGTARLLALHKRNIFLVMFWLIGTVLICPANEAPFASTRHGNVLKSASGRGTGAKLAAGPAYSDRMRTHIL
jgi:hypothetical protein